MKAMILAAGRGERMRPLTDHTPKPLLPIGGKPLIVWHLERLRRAGFQEVVINHAHLGHQIEAALSDGRQWDLKIQYSPEPSGALETAGGIRHALPLLGDAPFLVINGDIWCDWPLEKAATLSNEWRHLAPPRAHLVLVSNPPQHPAGDFLLREQRVCNPLPTGEAGDEPDTLTFSGIGLYTPALFADLPDNTPAKLAPLLRQLADRQHLTGEHHAGVWADIGTPERLAEINARVREQTA